MGGPKAGAFKGPINKVSGRREISNWDRTDTARRGYNVELLRTGNLAEHRNTVYLKAADYIDAADQAQKARGQPCLIDIVNTPHSVEPEQQPWAYAHVDVVEIETDKTAREFRENLCNQARKTQLIDMMEEPPPCGGVIAIAAAAEGRAARTRLSISRVMDLA